ncbi:hypothetical protein SIM22_05850 [Bacillus cereus group sp. BfR-BA-01363]|uniref:hypothetical protein n=1 Tax=Bacillus cereus group sp. BfR-BA-01363 TaxID=3094882 RepID=UPI0029C51E4C|nr:hypothetical protein [Bacillus cereus group sp. BfR-BA-01363]MDX5853626.1 hypothetical protein [Bacillus cereus group sp. BfR-BA-01363]
MSEKTLFLEKEKHCTKKDLLNALDVLSNNGLVFISNGEDFFPIKEIVQDEEGDDVIIRVSDKPY